MMNRYNVDFTCTLINYVKKTNERNGNDVWIQIDYINSFPS